MTNDRETPREQHRGWYRTHKLPHRDEPYLTQTVTFRLADSLPRDVVVELAGQLKLNPKLSAPQRKKIETCLDAGYGKCLLGTAQIAALVTEALQFRNQEWYELVAWVIMPNHVHVVLHLQKGIRLSTIVQSWKSYTAHEANRLLQRKGPFWQTGYFDRYVRDDTHFSNTIHYIHMNPVHAGLAATPGSWQYSSARYWGLE